MDKNFVKELTTQFCNIAELLAKTCADLTADIRANQQAINLAYIGLVDDRTALKSIADTIDAFVESIEDTHSELMDSTSLAEDICLDLHTLADDGYIDDYDYADTLVCGGSISDTDDDDDADSEVEVY